MVAKPGDLEVIVDYLNEHLRAIERKDDWNTLEVHVVDANSFDMLAQRMMETAGAIVLLRWSSAKCIDAMFSIRGECAGVGARDSEHDVHNHAPAIAARSKTCSIAIATSTFSAALSKPVLRERHELTEWARLPVDDIACATPEVLAEDSERAVRLRQTLPVQPAAEREAACSETDADVIAAVTRR